MAYLVRIIARTERDFEQLFNDVNGGGSESTLKWYRGLQEAVLGLEQHPKRCPLTPENANLKQLPYGRKPHLYRVINRIIETDGHVDVLYIRHGARRRFKAPEVE